MSIKPMLAVSVDDLQTIADKFPLYASPKLDGIRALILNGQVVSRNMKPIPNKYVQKVFGSLPEFLDGELIVGKPTDKDCFRNTTSGVMSVDGMPDAEFYVFDKYDCAYTFEQRQRLVKAWIKTGGMRKIRVVTQTLIKDAFELHDYEQEMLSRGYEGVMLRDPSGLYKQGRSTLKEGGLMKVKKFLDAEAEIQDVIELQHNENEQILDELGRSKRSSHKAGKRAGGKMGALSVRNVVNGVSFEIGAGFTDEDREWFWRHRKEAVRLRWWIKYRYFPSGSKDKPRFPVYVGLRHLNDL